MKNIRLIEKIVSFALIFIVCLSINVYANENTNEVKEYYSDAYLEYLELSDEEKAKKEVIPEKYEVSVREYFSKRKDMTLVGEVEEIPAKFDLRDVINVKVENQGAYGLCWAFATNNTVETNLALNNLGDYDFSEMHVNYLTSMEYCEAMGLDNLSWRNLHDGGNFSIYYTDYALLEYGPVLEETVPYEEVAEKNYSSLMGYTPETYIHDVVRFPNITDEEDESTKNIVIQDIKRHIMENGSLYASICSLGIVEDEYAVLNVPDYINSSYIDHAISIIGWDDDYPKENFPEYCRPENNGAYIALNSWGEDFGDNGIFYISYEDNLVHGELSGVVLANKEPYNEVTIPFEDENLFNYFSTMYHSYISEIDIENKTVVMKESYIKLITQIYLSEVQSLKGLEYFTELEMIWLGNSVSLNPEDIDILKGLKNLKELYFDSSYIEDWSFIKQLNLKAISLLDTNFNDFTILTEVDSIESFYLYNFNYENTYDVYLDLSECENLRRLTLSFDMYDNVWVTGLNKNMKEVDLSFVQIVASALDGCKELERLNLSNTWTDTLKFITKDFNKLKEITINGLNVDIKPIANLEQDVMVYLVDMAVDNLDMLLNKENITVEVHECTITEYLVEEINVGSKKKIETPKPVTYVYEYFMNNEYYMNADIAVTNGSISNNLKNIVLKTDKKEVSIPLEIEVYNSNYDFENSYLKYIIYYDVVKKDGWFSDYAKVTYSTHVQNDGWQDYVGNNQIAGTSGRALRLEGIKIDLDSNIAGAGIQYSTHVENIGWQDYVTDNVMSGTEGQALRLEAIKIKLSEELEVFYDIYYRVHAQNIGWMNWAKNGEIAGTAGMSLRLEAIQIMLVEKGSSYPIPIPTPDYNNAYKEIPHIIYNTHIENIGWTEFSRDGIASGSLGKNLRMEAFTASIESSYEGGVYYKVYTENDGWQDELSGNGEIAGTEGESLKVHTIYMFLTGELEERYDIYYRVLLDNETEWQGWTSNGEAAGNYRPERMIQAIQIVLREKGGLPPKDTGRPPVIFYDDGEAVG